MRVIRNKGLIIALNIIGFAFISFPLQAQEPEQEPNPFKGERDFKVYAMSGSRSESQEWLETLNRLEERMSPKHNFWKRLRMDNDKAVYQVSWHGFLPVASDDPDERWWAWASKLFEESYFFPETIKWAKNYGYTAQIDFKTGVIFYLYTIAPDGRRMDTIHAR